MAEWYNESVQKIVECVPNFSEGKRLGVIRTIVAAAKKGKNLKVLDVEWNASHNRSLVTLVGEPDSVYQTVFSMIKAATRLIDMRVHKGEHPRIGATDVVPFIPVSGMTIGDCVLLAKKLGKRVAEELDIPVYLYEAAATRPERINLADIRIGQFEGLRSEIHIDPKRKPDFGPSVLHETAGAIVIGARKFLIAYNVNLDTQDVVVAKDIARIIREKNGGLPGVKAMGFLVGGFAQISMNLVDYEKTNINKVYAVIEEETKKQKISIRNSEIYGMVPLDALIRFVKETIRADGFTSDHVLEKKMNEK